MAGQVRRARGGKRADDLRGEFTVVAVPGTHRDRTKKVYGQGRDHKNRRQTMAEKQKLLLEYRRDGLSWREAGRRVGYKSVSAAYDAGMAAIRDIPREAADEARTIELQRIDEVLRTFMPLMRRGDTDAGNVVLRAIDRRARMLGLDLAEPEQATLDVHVKALLLPLLGMGMPELEAELAEQLARIEQNRAEQVGRGLTNGKVYDDVPVS
jgi:hypothetical protein